MSTQASASAAPLPRPEPLRALVTVLDEERLALPLDAVLEILPAMAFTPLPTAPDVVRGVINLRGKPLPLVDLRTRLGSEPRPPRPDDHIVVCRVGDRAVGMWLDHAEGMVEVDTTAMVPVTDVARARHVEGVALLPDGMLLVCDVRSFLSADEALSLDAALHDSGVGGRR